MDADTTQAPLLADAARPAAVSLPGISKVLYQRSWWEVWYAQYVALVWKSLSIIRFRAISTLLILFMPSIFLGALYGLYSNLSTVDVSPQTLRIARCASFDVYNQPSSAPCTTLVYAPSTPVTDGIMASVASANGLSSSDVLAFADVTAMAEWGFDTLATGQLDTAVHFANVSSVSQVTYSLWVNSSRIVAYAQRGMDPLWRSTGVSGRLLAVQQQLDAAIIAAAVAAAVREDGVQVEEQEEEGVAAPRSMLRARPAGMDGLTDGAAMLGAGSPTLDTTVAPFSDWEIYGFAQNGPALSLLLLAAATCIVTGIVLASVLIMTIITGEKARKLVGSLRTIGLYESAFWLSWFTAYVPVLLGASMIAALVGMGTGILLFTNTDYGIHMLAMFLLGTSTLSMALCCASCMRAQRWVNIAAFCKFAVAVTLTTLFAAFGLYWIIYAPMIPTILPIALCWMPFFHYGKLISSIIIYIYLSSSSSGSTGAMQDPMAHMGTIAGHMMNISRSDTPFISSKHFKPFLRDAMFGYDIYIPADAGTQDAGALGAGFGPSAASRVFGWTQLAEQPAAITVYVDAFPQQWQDVAPSFNLWMMLVLTIGYLMVAWYIGQVATGDLGAAQPFYFIVSPYYWGLMKLPAQLQEGDTLALVQRLSAEEQSIRVHKVSKSYAKNTALKEVSLVLPAGQCTALLGQNGAGKSTLCHILAGLISPTHGEAYMFGKSVRTEMALLRDCVGICPQDDLLWEELTARQHVEMFARFKGVPERKLREHAEARLQLVQLLDNADAYVKTFSGGMKRRLSVAMAAVGSPRIIFLDEPTTGLDPISKRRVHAMIEQLKPGRVLVLTTHNMQEADALGDTVAILADGKLRAYGTPLYLKNRFGAGYQVNIITEPAQAATVKAIVQEELPGAEFVGDLTAPADNGVPMPTMMPMMGALTPSAAVMAAMVAGGAVAGAGDVLRARVASGAVTVAVPRARLSEIPRLLRRLQALSRKLDGTAATPVSPNDPSIREWGISASTLEEVFLKLAAANNAINAVADTSDGSASMQSMGITAGAARGQAAVAAVPTRKMCALCRSALTENVVLYNSQRVVVAVDGIICAACATRTEEEIKEARSGKAAPAVVASTTVVAAPAAAVTPAPASAAVHPSMLLSGAGPVSEVRGAVHSMPPVVGGAAQQRKMPIVRGVDDDDYVEPVSWFTQFMAVFCLRWQLQWKQRWSNVCNLCFVLVGVILTTAITPAAVPIAGVRCLGSGGYFVQNSGLCNRGIFAAQMTTALPNTPIPDHSYGVQSSSVRDPYIQGNVAHLLYATTCTNWVGGACVSKAVAPDWLQAAVSYASAGNNVAYGAGVSYLDGDPNGVPLAAYDLLGSGLGGATVVPSVAAFVNVGAVAPSQNGAGVDSLVYNAQKADHDASGPMTGGCANNYGQASFGSFVGYQFENMSLADTWLLTNFPGAGVGVRLSRPFDAAPSLAYDLRVWAAFSDNDYSPQRGNIYTWTNVYASNGPSCLGDFVQQPSDDPWADNTQTTPAAVAMTGLHNAFLRTALEKQSGSNSSSAYIYTSYVQWPSVKWQPAVQGSNTAFQALLWPLFTLFLLPLFVYPIAFEKDHKLYAMMSMSGMRHSPYMAAHYAFSFIVFTTVASIYCIAGRLAGVPAFRNTGPELFVALLMTWGHAQTGFAIFIASVFQNPRTATIISYLLCVVVAVGSFLIYQFTDPWPTAVTWVPFMGYTRASTLVLNYGGSSVANGSELQSALLITAFEGTLALLLGVYFHAVLPGPESIAPLRHPAYPVEELLAAWAALRALFGYRAPATPEEYSTLASGEGFSVNRAGDDAEDPDVVSERDRVRQGDLSNAAIVLDGLVKEYGSRDAAGKERNSVRAAFERLLSLASMGNVATTQLKRAVNDLCLAVNYGECLGLLGPNGAGKTTTISMLTGMSEITGGSALLAGHSVATQLASIWRVLGVTPQFDTQWDELSVSEHLYFFARMKGVAGSRMRGVVQSVAEKVNLDGDAFAQMSRGLSGGMRRRLSIAIALLGDPAPALVFLDEPSTGLDPASRRDVWRILQSERNAGRAMIITTHAMDEADALCDRIAIMYGGKLQCVGNQLRLKSKYGNGYKLTVTLRDPSPDGFAITQLFVADSLSSHARLLTRVGATVSYMLPPEGTDVANLFQVLEAQKDRANIQEYGIAATTLEEVFVRVCEGAEARAGAAPAPIVAMSDYTSMDA